MTAPSVTKLPDADRIEGMSYVGNAEPRLGRVEVQYRTHTNRLYELHIPLLDALFLLGMLQQLVKDKGLEHLLQAPKK